MIGIDTNVLLRLLVRDDPEQHRQAATFFSQRTPRDPAFVSAVVLAETIWTLRRRYGFTEAKLLSILQDMLSSDDFHFEHGDRLARLLEGPAGVSLNIADHLVAWSGAAAGCRGTVTFDQRAASTIPEMELLA